MKLNWLFALLTISSLCFADVSVMTEKYAKTFLTTKHSRVQVIINTDPSWCPACVAYEPIVKQVAKEFKNVDFITNAKFRLPDEPNYIPWTFIYTNNPKCRTTLEGRVDYEVLKAAVEQAVKCDK